ncbi:MAG: lipid-A-disaccharide synthase-related protein [Candidatus Aerophobetes bacterium]|nr:lipid-A-disaccharide synthase-related protein [Candidatus Aerophobetes bacterium]
MDKKNILFLSNGYAEDTIAARIIEELLKLPYPLNIKALPLVGEGKAYAHLNIKVLGSRKIMPSGGFAGLNPSLLVKDIRAGWLKVFKECIDILRSERKLTDFVVCVGDVFLILLSSFFVKKPIIFLPTAKSDYAKGMKEHYRIEKWLIRRLCQLVIPRDKKTASSLQDFNINAIYLGNVMMDCLSITNEDFGIGEARYKVGILPGSKKEAYDNFTVVLDTVKLIAQEMSSLGKVAFLLSLSPSLDLKKLSKKPDWKLTLNSFSEKKEGIVASLTSDKETFIKIIRGRFGDVVHSSQVIIGLAGMANEQAVGLGKPVVSFPGRGPQITKKFLYIQRMLLGGAISIVDRNAESVAKEVCSLLTNPHRLNNMAKIGSQRMGGSGGAKRVARLIANFPPASPLSSSSL